MFIFVSLLIIYYDSIYRFSFRVIKYIYYKIRDYFWNVCAKHYIFYPSEKLETNLDCNYWCTCAMGNHDRCRRNFMVLSKILVWNRYIISLTKIFTNKETIAHSLFVLLK